MSTGCECPLAGYCARHKRNKTQHLHRLCQTDQRYFNYWESPPSEESPPPSSSDAEAKRLEILRSLWAELHSYNPGKWVAEEAEKWFAWWLRRVPSFGCSCQSHFKDIIKKHPPDFSSHDSFFEWTVARHNDVNQRLGKEIFTLEKARMLYAPN